jgi:hypothetical protein
LSVFSMWDWETCKMREPFNLAYGFIILFGGNLSLSFSSIILVLPASLNPHHSSV